MKPRNRMISMARITKELPMKCAALLNISQLSFGSKNGKIIENAGIQANMHYEKTDKKKTCDCHHKLLADGGGKNRRPVHLNLFVF